MLIFRLLLSSICCKLASATVATLVTLSDYVGGSGAPESSFNARSLDGSPYEIWFAPATSPVNASKWVIDIQGGAWCQDLAACAARAYSPGGCYLGSSNASCFNADSERCANKSAAMSFECLPACNGARWCGGLFVNDSATNPLSHDWNQVLLPYHDGQSFSGGAVAATVTSFNGRDVPLWFRGHANFQAALDWLVRHAGLGAATEVGLTGNSAGGLATYYHADELTALLPRARVWAAPDSGFFYADDTAFPSWAAGLRAMVTMANATAGLDASCVAAMRAGGRDPADCAFPEVVALHVSTPLFVMQGRYDPALTSIASGERGANASHVNAIGRHVLDLLYNTVLRRPENAAFVTACAEHCGQWAQGVDGDFNVTIGGQSAVPFLARWRAGAAAGQQLLQAPGDSYPCAECCHGGPPAPPNVSLVLLTQAAADDGAVCLDSSPPALYIDHADPEHFLIFQEGGGWCSSPSQCSDRANSTLGSSKFDPAWSSTIMLSENFLLNDPRVNAPFWNWTRVFLRYCDGSSQTSDVSSPVVIDPPTPISPIYYRGARVRAAQQEYLLASAGLGAAKEIVIAGCSAGGLSTYLHVDKWAAAVPNAKVRGMADSGFFLNYDWTTGTAGSGQPGDPHFPSNVSYPWRMWWMWSVANLTGALPPACVAAQSAGSEWLCLFAETLVPWLATPIFALQSYFDSYQSQAIAHLSQPNPNVSALNAYGARLRDTVKNAFAEKPQSGYALDACFHHCGANCWDDVTFPNGLSQSQAADSWRRGTGASVEQIAAYPCSSCCGTAT